MPPYPYYRGPRRGPVRFGQRDLEDPQAQAEAVEAMEAAEDGEYTVSDYYRRDLLRNPLLAPLTPGFYTTRNLLGASPPRVGYQTPGITPDPHQPGVWRETVGMRPKTREERQTALLGPGARQALGQARLEHQRFYLPPGGRQRDDISAAIAQSTGKMHFDWSDPGDVAGLAWKGVEGYGAAALLAAPAFAIRAGISRFLPRAAKTLSSDLSTAHYNKFLSQTPTPGSRFLGRMLGGKAGQGGRAGLDPDAFGPTVGPVRQALERVIQAQLGAPGMAMYEAFGTGVGLGGPIAATGALVGGLGIAGRGFGEVFRALGAGAEGFDAHDRIGAIGDTLGSLPSLQGAAGGLLSETRARISDLSAKAFVPAGAFETDLSGRAIDSIDAVADRGIDALYGGDLPAATVKAIPPTTAPSPGLRRAVTGRATEAPEQAAPARTGRYVEPAEVFNANVAATQLGYRDRTGILDPSFPGGF